MGHKKENQGILVGPSNSSILEVLNTLSYLSVPYLRFSHPEVFSFKIPYSCSDFKFSRHLSLTVSNWATDTTFTC